MVSGRKTVVILNGSPRRNGNTASVLKWLEQALAKTGFDLARHDLYRMKFKGCAHCDRCKQVAHETACRLNDDLRPVLDEIARAKVIVVASPVYCWSVSGCTSAALDRFYCFFKDRGSLISGKKMVGVFTAGGDLFDGMDLCVDMLKRLCEYGEADYSGTLAAGSCGEPSATRRRKDLKRAAEELAAVIGT